MNQDRVIKIVQSELESDRLKLEEDLEITLNNPMDTTKKVKKVKVLLKKITQLESMLEKFKSFLPDDSE